MRVRWLVVTLGASGLLLTACQPEPDPPRYVLGMTVEDGTPTVVVAPCPVDDGYGYGHDLAVFLASTTVKEDPTVWTIESEVPTWELEDGSTLPARIPIGSAPEGYTVAVDRLPLEPDLRYTAKTGYDDRSVDFVASKLEAGRIWDGQEFVSEDALRGHCGRDEDRLGDAIIVVFVGLILVVVLGALTVVGGALLLPTAAVLRVQRRHRLVAEAGSPPPVPVGTPREPPRWPPPGYRPPETSSPPPPPLPPGPAPPRRDALPPAPPPRVRPVGARHLTARQEVLVLTFNLALLVPLVFWAGMAQSGGSEAAPALVTVVGVQVLLLLVDSFAEQNAGRPGRSGLSWALGVAAALPLWAMLSGVWSTSLSGLDLFVLALVPLGGFWWWRLRPSRAGGPSGSSGSPTS